MARDIPALTRVLSLSVFGTRAGSTSIFPIYYPCSMSRLCLAEIPSWFQTIKQALCYGVDIRANPKTPVSETFSLIRS